MANQELFDHLPLPLSRETVEELGTIGSLGDVHKLLQKQFKEQFPVHTISESEASAALENFTNLHSERQQKIQALRNEIEDYHSMAPPQLLAEIWKADIAKKIAKVETTVETLLKVSAYDDYIHSTNNWSCKALQMRMRQLREPELWTLTMQQWCDVIDHFVKTEVYREIKKKKRFVSMYE